MAGVLDYPDVLQDVRGEMNAGRLKLQSSNVIFKNIKTGKVDQYKSSDVEQATWLSRARGYCLKMRLSSGTIHRYDGFKESEYDKMFSFMKKNYNLTLDKKEPSLKGWNWGAVLFKGASLEFEVNGKSAFEIPLGNVSNSMTGKNEVSLEFHPNDDAAVSLMELRFHIPSGEKDSTEKDPVEEFCDNVLQKADIIQATGNAIAIFSEIHCLTPRGRYDIKLFPSFLQLHGKTFDYKIPYKTILRLFLLPHRDKQMYFVVSLDPPIKQGRTRYHFLILLFNKEDETTLELEMTEEEIEEKYPGKLTKEMSGPEYEIVSRIMKALVKTKITVPGSFVGHTGTRSVSCSYKAATGYLYPLERGFIFVHKPPLHIRFDEVASVNFARSTGNTRFFDFDVDTKAGAVYTFVGIEKDEYAKLYDFVSQKKLRVKNIGKLDKGGGYKDDMTGSDDEGHDAYMERMKAEGKQRDDDDDDDDDDSSDVSFAPGGSGSDVAEEFDSNPPDSSDSNANASDGGHSKKDRDAGDSKKKSHKNKSKSSITVSEGGRKKKKKKSKREAGQPKRAQSAYFLWLNDQRAGIKADNPGIAVTEISKKAGEMWRRIEAGEKAKYEELAVEAKGEYEKEMAAWKKENAGRSSSPSHSSPTKKKKRKGKSAATSSPSKTTGGTGDHYKSKEFISSSDGEGNDSPRKGNKGSGSESEKVEDASGSESEKVSGSGSESEKVGTSGNESEEPRKKKMKNGDDAASEEEEEEVSD